MNYCFHVDTALGVTIQTPQSQIRYNQQSGVELCNRGNGHVFIEDVCALCWAPGKTKKADSTLAIADLLDLGADLSPATKLELHLILIQPISSRQRLSEAFEWARHIAWTPWGRGEVDWILDAFVGLYPEAVCE